MRTQIYMYTLLKMGHSKQSLGHYSLLVIKKFEGCF